MITLKKKPCFWKAKQPFRIFSKEEQDPGAQEIADTLLQDAIRLDQGRPNDDMSVVVLRVVSRQPDAIRRMTVRLPVPTNAS